MHFSNKYAWKRKIMRSMVMVMVLILCAMVGTAFCFYFKVWFATPESEGGLGWTKRGAQIAGVMQAGQIAIGNEIMIIMARILTDQENHRTNSSYEAQYVMKTFLFRFCNSYSSFFYIAFLKVRPQRRHRGAARTRGAARPPASPASPASPTSAPTCPPVRPPARPLPYSLSLCVRAPIHYTQTPAFSGPSPTAVPAGGAVSSGPAVHGGAPDPARDGLRGLLHRPEHGRVSEALHDVQAAVGLGRKAGLRRQRQLQRP